VLTGVLRVAPLAPLAAEQPWPVALLVVRAVSPVALAQPSPLAAVREWWVYPLGRERLCLWA
jgi:hypothetical protein